VVIRRAGNRFVSRLTLVAAFIAACVPAVHATGDSIRITRTSVATILLLQGTPQTSQPTELKDDPRYRRWQFTLTWGLVILIAFVTAAVAIVVFSRGFRRWIGREKKAPTASDDVWAMHKAPEIPPELLDEDDDQE
jgi:hypothetical protein